MKNILDILNESSLMDDEDTIIKAGLPYSIMVQYDNKKRSKTPKDLDMFGNELSVGDIVLGVYLNRPSIGIIRQIREGTGMCAVQYTKDGKELKTTSQGDYQTKVALYELLKISTEIGMSLIK